MLCKIILFVTLLASPALALWSCTEDSHCSSMEGSICREGDCVCPVGQQSVRGGTLCVDVAPYHLSPCYEDHQCSRMSVAFQCLQNEENEEGICYCQPGHHFFLGRCWQSAGYGETCNRDEECLSQLRDPFSLSCNGTCVCAEEYYSRQAGECRRIAFAVGDGCVLDEDCQFPGGVCNAVTLLCVNAGLRETVEVTLPEPRDVIVTSSVHNISCSSDSDCPNTHVCSQWGVCVCPVGYYSNEDGSLCYADLGSPSTVAQCIGLFAEVNNGICTCPANFFFEPNMRDCVKATRTITDSCVSDENCFTFGAAGRCGAPGLWGMRSCECVPEMAVWDADRQMCRLFAGIGEECDVDSDCLAGELEIQCVADSTGQGYCTCPEGLTAIDGLCLTTGLELGDTCQASTECTETLHTECINGTCDCGSGYIASGNICAPVIGGECAQSSECVVENTVCATSNNASTCQCAESFVEFDEACWEVVTTFGGSCNITQQCTDSFGEGSACSDGVCSCSPSFHHRDGRCWVETGLFQDCSRTSECFLGENSERTVCRNGFCQCQFHYPYSEALNTCISGAFTSTASSLVLLITALFYVTFS